MIFFSFFQPPKDSYLFLFVMVFVLVDLIILSISTGLDNVRLEAELFDDREHPSKPDVRKLLC